MAGRTRQKVPLAFDVTYSSPGAAPSWDMSVRAAAVASPRPWGTRTTETACAAALRAKDSEFPPSEATAEARAGAARSSEREEREAAMDVSWSWEPGPLRRVARIPSSAGRRTRTLERSGPV